MALLLCGLCAGLPTPARSQDRPWAVDQIEQDFAGRFMLTTTDGQAYDVYQRVESPEGIPVDANVVCMLHNECYLEIAHVPEGALGRYDQGHGSLGPLRQRLNTVRNSYDLMRAAPPDRQSAAADTWHSAIAQLSRCLAALDTCR